MKIGITYNLAPEALESVETPNDRADEFDTIETVENIEKGILALGYEPVRLGFGLEAMHKLELHPVDLVFNIAEGLYGRAREAQMPALLDMLKIPYTFSDTLAVALALNKTLTKQVLKQEGINTPTFEYVEDMARLEQLIKSRMVRYPSFVKPSSEGSSMGINENSKVTSDEELRHQVQTLITTYPGSNVLIEEYLPGKEVTVGILGNRVPTIMGVMSFKLLGLEEKDFFYTPEIKHNWEKYLVPECPARLTYTEYNRVCRLALRIYKILRCRDCARIDFRFDRNNQPSFVEINPLAGLTKGKSDIPVMAELMGISYETLIGDIIKEAIKRTGCLKTSKITALQKIKPSKKACALSTISPVQKV